MVRRAWASVAPVLALTAAQPAGAGAPEPPRPAPERVHVTGEVVDTWCTVSQVMGYALGTAHYQCSVWCAVGGIPVSIRSDDDQYYVVLRVGGDTANVGNPRIIDIQAHHVTVDGDLFVRDGVNYLLVDAVSADDGIVNLSHQDYGIVPFGD